MSGFASRALNKYRLEPPPAGPTGHCSAFLNLTGYSPPLSTLSMRTAPGATRMPPRHRVDGRMPPRQSSVPRHHLLEALLEVARHRVAARHLAKDADPGTTRSLRQRSHRGRKRVPRGHEDGQPVQTRGGIQRQLLLPILDGLMDRGTEVVA